MRAPNLLAPGSVRYPFVSDWSVASSKDGGSWRRGRVFKSLCGPLTRYDEFATTTPVLCAVGVLFETRDPGLRSISGCGRTESARGHNQIKRNLNSNSLTYVQV